MRFCSVLGCGGKHYEKGLCSKHYSSSYRERKGVKERYESQRKFRRIQREYHDLLCRYEEKNGAIPKVEILRLEALSDYLGRDLEEWRVGKDKERYIKMLLEKKED